jgi:protein-disulfide isomerase
MKRPIAPRLINVVSLLILIAGAGWLVQGAVNFAPRAGAERIERTASSPDSLGLSDFASLLQDGHWLGPENAPAVILVYSTYFCGFCAELQQSISMLRSKYPQHLAIVVKQYVQPLRGPELDMALAAECAAAMGDFEHFHSLAFMHPEIAGSPDGWQAIADSAGIQPRDEFTDCVRSQRYATAIEASFREGSKLHVRGTPTLFVNGYRIYGAPPPNALDTLVAKALRRS